MAWHSIIEERENEEFYTTDSRYKNIKVIVYDDTEERLETVETLYVEPSDEDTYHQVSVGQQNRLDIIAQKYYGNATLWWVIALVNELLDPFEIPAGLVLKVPPISRIFGYKGILV